MDMNHTLRVLIEAIEPSYLALGLKKIRKLDICPENARAKKLIEYLEDLLRFNKCFAMRLAH